MYSTYDTCGEWTTRHARIIDVPGDVRESIRVCVIEYFVEPGVSVKAEYARVWVLLGEGGDIVSENAVVELDVGFDRAVVCCADMRRRPLLWGNVDEEVGTTEAVIVCKLLSFIY